MIVCSHKQVSREDQLLRKHLQAVYQEEQLSNPQDFGYHLMTTISQRPKSLAGPGMTTSSSPFSFLHEPQVTQQSWLISVQWGFQLFKSVVFVETRKKLRFYV